MIRCGFPPEGTAAELNIADDLVGDAVMLQHPIANQDEPVARDGLLDNFVQQFPRLGDGPSGDMHVAMQGKI